jgi:hypothetical protein
MKEKSYKIAQKICRQALKGKLSLEEFFKIWPQENQDAFLKIVYEDVEDAVEHLPSSFITKKIDWNAWKKMDTYKNLLIDNELLALWVSDPQKLLECHDIASKKQFTSEVEIKEFVRNFMPTTPTAGC